MRQDPDPRIEERPDVVVVGGGLAGLSAATVTAREGATVVLVEARRELGGRARSDLVAQAVVNHGAHALYRAGAGSAVLRELGVVPQGRAPRQRGVAWSRDGVRTSALDVSAMGGRHGLRGVRRVLGPGRARRADAEGRSMADWLDRHVPDRGRAAAEAVVRTATYSAAMDLLAADAGLAQVGLARRGVLYLHGGWAGLVADLAARAEDAGVRTTTGKVERVVAVGGVHRVEVRGAGSLHAPVVVLAAGGPGAAAAMVPESSRLETWSDAARPVRAACWDAVVGPGGRRVGPTYGLGEPTYLVDHAVSARLAPPGVAVLHGLVYEPERSPHLDPRATLEAMADAAAPTWRDRLEHAVVRRGLTVAHDRPQPGRAAEEGPQVEVDDAPGILVAGDWLTGHGMLADAALASGAAAGRRAGRLVHRLTPVP